MQTLTCKKTEFPKTNYILIVQICYIFLYHYNIIHYSDTIV